MKPALTKSTSALYHYTNGARVAGPNPRMTGNCSGLRGDCTGLWGDLDACELSAEDRARGVDIRELVA